MRIYNLSFSVMVSVSYCEIVLYIDRKIGQYHIFLLYYDNFS